MFIVGEIKCSWLIPHEQAICFSSLIWLSRNKSVKKSRFSRMVKNSREFSLLDLDLEAFWFHFSLLEKEWKHFDFTLHFSKKSESIFFSLCTSRKRVKAFYFHFSLLELQKPTLAGPWYIYFISFVRNDQKKQTIFRHKGCRLLVIEPVHCGSSGILLIPFFGTPCIFLL